MAFLSFQSITKRFPGVLALDDVSFDVERGECHALVGENGAGKSTIGKILAGVYTADAGEIRLEGLRIEPGTPLAGRQLGIAMVHQELAFCPNLTVAENLCLGDLPCRNGWLDLPAMQARARRMLEGINAELDVDEPIGALSTGQEQLVQIAGALGTDARIIIMDEPTSSLSARESQSLFELIGHLKTRGITILYVSHRLEEIFRLCDRATVLRDGRHVVTKSVVDTTPDDLIHAMIGRELTPREPEHVRRQLGPELLQVEDLASPGKFEGARFCLNAGEILGFAGLVGAGRSEIAQAIFGLDRLATGRVRVAGQELVLHSVEAALAAGLGYVPEDRKRQGLILSMNCRENASLSALPGLTRAGFVQRRAERLLVQQYVEQLRVKTPSLDAPIVGLSGGNQQKIALAKWLSTRCRVLIVDEPTRGIDVGAKAEIHALLDRLACQGLAILMISSELPELMNLSRRILVWRQGRFQGEVFRPSFSQPGLMRLMAGIASARAG